MDNSKLKKQIRDRITKKAEEWIGGIDKNIENKLEIALLSFLGLEGHFNRGYEIDHCNGRNSVFIDILREKAEKEASNLVGKIKRIKKSEDFKLFKTAFEKEYSSHFSRAINDLARSKASEDAEKYFNNIFDKELKKNIIE